MSEMGKEHSDAVSELESSTHAIILQSIRPKATAQSPLSLSLRLYPCPY